MVSDPSSRYDRWWTRPASVAAATYAVGTLFLCFPIVSHLNWGLKDLPYGDVGQHFWNIWWLEKALTDPHASIFWCDRLFYPDGAGLAFHAYHPVLSLPVLFLSPLLGRIAAYNLVLILGIWASAWFTYLCAREWGAGPRAAWVAGFFFLFAPFRREIWGHWEMMSTQWMPLALLFMHRAFTRERLRSWLGNAAAWAVFVLLTAFSSWYHLFSLIAVFLVLVPALLFDTLGKEAVLRRLAAVAAAALATLILFLPMLRVLLKQYDPRGQVFSEPALYHWSADVLHYILPLPAQEWFAAKTHGGPIPRLITGGNLIVYPGTSLWILVILVVFLVRRKAARKSLLVASLALIVLSMGPYLKCAGFVRLSEQGDGFMMPAHILRKIPLIRSVRTFVRFGYGVPLLWGLFIALNLERLEERLPGVLRKARSIFALMLGVLAVWEGFRQPSGMHPVRVPTIYSKVIGNGKDASVLEIPCRDISDLAAAMYYQTFHEHPLIGGYLAREIAEFEDRIRNTALLRVCYFAFRGEKQAWREMDREDEKLLSLTLEAEIQRAVSDPGGAVSQRYRKEAQGLGLGFIIVNEGRLVPEDAVRARDLFVSSLGATRLCGEPGGRVLYGLEHGSDPLQ